MRAALAVVFLLALVFPVALGSANRCSHRCGEYAKACKHRCKARHPNFTPARHQCLERCEAEEHECKAHC